MPGLALPSSDEQELLLAYLAQQRQGVRNAAYGLNDEEGRSTPLTSALSIGGLIKHLADTERGWTDTILQKGPDSGDSGVSNYRANFRLEPDETLADVLARYDEVAVNTESVIATIADLD